MTPGFTHTIAREAKQEGDEAPGACPCLGLLLASHLPSANTGQSAVAEGSAMVTSGNQATGLRVEEEQFTDTTRGRAKPGHWVHYSVNNIGQTVQE